MSSVLVIEDEENLARFVELELQHEDMIPMLKIMDVVG